MNCDRWAPGAVVAGLPEKEAEADPALNCVAEDEHDSVDVDESATEVDWYNLIHEDGDRSEHSLKVSISIRVLLQVMRIG